MTDEELERLRTMTKYQIIKKYWDERLVGNISQEQWDWLIDQGK